MEAMNAEVSQLGEFFDFMYHSDPGYVYLALKNRQTNDWTQEFFEWPTQRNQLITRVLQNRSDLEVYYGPAMYNSPSAKKPDVKGSNVLWVEFDGEVPTELGDVPPPSLRILSSLDGHEHWYWKLDQMLPGDVVERANRSLTYLFGADSSGWDSTQVLRPPGTFNHKRQREVSVLEWHHDKPVPFVLFQTLPEPPPPVGSESLGPIPDIQETVWKYKWEAQARELFKNGQPMGQRSSGLMQLGYFCAEMNMTNEEMVTILLNADERWGKFKDRSDRMLRLMEIVTIARAKHPYSNGVALTEAETPKLQPMGLLTLLRTEIHLEWVWEGLLQKGGYMLSTGPSGVGKTQLALDAAMHMALGQRYHDRNVNPDGTKIGFLSLEMGLMDLKYFLLTMAGRYTEEEQRWLEENLLFFPLGEPLYMNRKEEKAMIEQVVGDLGLQGIIVDSLGSTTEGELTNEGDVKNIMDWNDRMRQRTGAFSWFIHHHRKATGDNKKPNKLADVFGSQYITARATTVSALWETTTPNVLEFIPLKVRLSKKPPKYNIERDGYLHLTKKASLITPGKSEIEIDIGDEIEVQEANEIDKFSI